MKITVKVGDRVHPCINVRGISYARAYRHSCLFIVVAVARDGIFCRIIKDGITGRSTFKYRSWSRALQNNRGQTMAPHAPTQGEPS